MSLSAERAEAPATLDVERVLVLDFGAQYAQLIARRVREQNVYCEIVRHDITPEQIAKHAPRGLILSGGPSSVYDAAAPHCDPRIFEMGLPVLGICYGMQLACEALGGLSSEPLPSGSSSGVSAPLLSVTLTSRR